MGMGYCIPGTLTTSLPASNSTHTKSLSFCRYTLSASIQKNNIPLIGKKAGRRLIRISTAEGKWQGSWNADYSFSLRDLQLEDLVEDGDPNNTRVFVSLSIERHAGFGLSVDGAIDTSFTRKCSNCSLPYCRQISTNFNVWVLSTTKDGDSNQLPEIGGDDPSVIYVKPGCEADLDSLIQDTIRLTTSVNVRMTGTHVDDHCSVFSRKSAQIFVTNQNMG
uniref:large ribosomal RNA subunit accumulation protein YCED homolog 2, chloroplastic isoform X2 n=1 Tax=Erigeron canadensis TaxID=72917 RepID=UPI001CB98070|nr:large ribosomal RNA subunit accumulation protein YCED homolog 2, chloroplastic isoform X2 [Erigeron canadensis]